MSNNTNTKFRPAALEHFNVQGAVLDHETMTKMDLPALAVLVNVNHDDPESFVEREYRAAMEAEGYVNVGRIRIDSYGTDGVKL